MSDKFAVSVFFLLEAVNYYHKALILDVAAVLDPLLILTLYSDVFLEYWIQ